MSRSTLRKVRRLKAVTAPLIADLDRRKSEWEESLPFLARDHLLRVIAVFQYGESQVDEPLARAYSRALSKLGGNEAIALSRLRDMLEEESPDGAVKSKLGGNEAILLRMQDALEEKSPDGAVKSKPGWHEAITRLQLRDVFGEDPPDGRFKSKLSNRLREIPEWLLHFCEAYLSMSILGLEHPQWSESVSELTLAKSDKNAWPCLPQGVPERRHKGRKLAISLEESKNYLDISRKPQEEWTRHERRFIREIRARALSKNGMTESKQKEQVVDDLDDGAGRSDNEI
jgi:hypothetical protein